MEMAYNTVRKRAAGSLLKLYDAYAKWYSTCITFEVSKADLAGMVGTSPESISKNSKKTSS
ncbi:MAG: helix-turn-helix domain-containing protein [Ekhidna sp.]